MVDEFQKEVGKFLIELSEFLKDKNPNPFVAIAGLEIAKNQFLEAISRRKDFLNEKYKNIKF